jgi:hypothetical protein
VRRREEGGGGRGEERLTLSGGLRESSAVRGRGAGRPSFAWVEEDDDERLNDHLGTRHAT